MLDKHVVGGLDVEMYQEIVENARIATGARMVHVYRFVPEELKVYRIASSGLSSARAQQALGQIKRLFPGFHPSHVHPKVTVNPLMSRIYLEGKPVNASLEQITEGIVDPRIMAMAKLLIRLKYVFSCPLIVDGVVFGGLTFHHSQPMTRKQQATCEAFVRQVALTIENAHLLKVARQSVQELRHSRNLLTQGEDAFRRKLAELMHGHIQSHLLIAWHRLGDAEQLTTTNPAAAAELIAECRQMIDRVREQDVRGVSHLLHPSIIQVGLLPALQTLAHTYEDRLHVNIHTDGVIEKWDDPGDNQIPDGVRLSIYRVVEEALSNAHHHGQASNVQIRLSVHKHGVHVAVEDDGLGLGVEQIHPGLGLGTIDARVAQTGGTWSLQNNPDKGATLRAHVPW